jgi:hypothetical protein
MGGGTRGIQRGVAQARQCTSPIPPYTSRLSPPTPPPSCPGKIKIKNETYLFVGRRQLTVAGGCAVYNGRRRRRQQGGCSVGGGGGGGSGGSG